MKNSYRDGVAFTVNRVVLKYLKREERMREHRYRSEVYRYCRIQIMKTF